MDVRYETRLDHEVHKALDLTNRIVSRRGFVQGAGAGLTAAAVSGALTGAALADTAQTPEGGSADWRAKPDPVAEADIVETVDVDVLIVGAGTAGNVCFAAAAEEIEATGNKVLLIEKNEKGSGIRTSGMGFINTRLSEKYGVNVDRKAYVTDHLKYNLNFCDTRLLQTFANESGFVGNWLMDICEQNGDVCFGFEYNQGTPYNYQVWQTGHFPCALDAEGKEHPTDIDTPVLEYAEGLGGEYRNNTAMQYLEQDDSGRVTGAIATNADGAYIRINAAKGVMVCTGGYALNFDIYKDRQPTIYKTLDIAFGFPGCTGDGFKAMLWAGAEPTEMPSSMLFDRAALAPEEEPGNPVPYPRNMWTFSSQPWLKVNALGERFTNESCLYDMIIHAAAYQPGNAYYDIWDSTWADCIDSFETVGCSEIVKRRGGCDLDVYYTDTATDDEFAEYVQGNKDDIAAQMDQLVEAGVIIKADTIEELAEGLLIPADTLKATVERYNELADKGIDEDFGKEAHRLLPVATAPFYGVKMASWVLCTLDGIKQSPKHEALGADGLPIPGLYVGGVDAGSIFANSYPNLSSGMCCGHSVTFGYRAGKIMSHNDDPSYKLEIPITY